MDYTELNNYLNEMFIFLSKKYDIFVDKLNDLVHLNDEMVKLLGGHDLSSLKIENNLSFDDVYLLGRDIVKKINEDYLQDYDNLIKNGELDFGYNNEYSDSVSGYNEKIKYINIKREFNYTDVVDLIHEFIHYTNSKQFSKNRHILCEFLSIYFELYALDSLIKQGIPKEEVYYKKRLHHTRSTVNTLFNLESPLLMYKNFGNINNENLKSLNKYILKIDQNNFNQECNNLLIFLKNEKKEINVFNSNRNLKDNLGYKLAYCYRYLIGATLAFYARNYCDFKDIVWLNDNINKLDGNVIDILNKVNINVEDDSFIEKVKISINKYLEKYNIKNKVM